MSSVLNLVIKNRKIVFERCLIFNLTLEELLALQLFWKKWVMGRGVSIGVRVWGVGGEGVCSWQSVLLTMLCQREKQKDLCS